MRTAILPSKALLPEIMLNKSVTNIKARVLTSEMLLVSVDDADVDVEDSGTLCLMLFKLRSSSSLGGVMLYTALTDGIYIINKKKKRRENSIL